MKVVNCFRTCIFVILKTTGAGMRLRWALLWIAFELVSSSYWKQLTEKLTKLNSGCELLSNLYLRHIENNFVTLTFNEESVVNCFRTCIFVILKTTSGFRSNYAEKLWIAFELVSSSYWKQLAMEWCSNSICCELLSNLYLRHIENNSPSGLYSASTVVNCFRTCIFVILKTTPTFFWSAASMLWIAFELVSSSYWKQLCHFLSAFVFVVNCFRTCIFVILKTTDRKINKIK